MNLCLLGVTQIHVIFIRNGFPEEGATVIASAFRLNLNDCASCLRKHLSAHIIWAILLLSLLRPR